jgi:hypothetical protein
MASEPLSRSREFLCFWANASARCSQIGGSSGSSGAAISAPPDAFCMDGDDRQSPGVTQFPVVLFSAGPEINRIRGNSIYTSHHDLLDQPVPRF